MENAVTSFRLPECFTDNVLAAAKGEASKYTTLDRGSEGVRYHFDIWNLKPESQLFQDINKTLGDLLEAEFEVIRLHKCTPDHSISRHIDNAYPNNDTVIVRLDDEMDPRLWVNDSPIHEEKGLGYRLPEGTPHEVIGGFSVRYTLVGWCRPRDGIVAGMVSHTVS